MATETKDGRWRICYRLPGTGKRVTEYFGRGPEAKNAAEAREYEIKADKKRGTNLRRKTGVYLDDLSRAYLDDARSREASPKYIKEVRAILNGAILPRLCKVPVDAITYGEVMGMAMEAWGKLALPSRQRYLGYLRAIFRFGVRHGLTEKNPLAAWIRQKERSAEVRLDVDGLRKMIAVSRPHLAWALEVAFMTGARAGKSELFAIRWADVDFDRSVIRIRGSKTVESNRLVPVAPSFLARLIEKRAEAASPFVVEFCGRPITSIRTGIHSAVLRAGLTYHVRPYDLRHLFASVMLAGGADLAAVSKLLGHATIATTQGTYYHLLAGEKERAVTILPSVAPEKVARKVVKIR